MTLYPLYSIYPPSRGFILLQDFFQISNFPIPQDSINKTDFQIKRRLLGNLILQNKIKLYGLYQGETIVNGSYESKEFVRAFFSIRKEDALDIMYNKVASIHVQYITSDENGKTLELPTRQQISMFGGLYLKKLEILDLMLSFSQKNSNQMANNQDPINIDKKLKEKEEQIVNLIHSNNKKSLDLKQKDDEITRLKARIAELEAKNTQLSTTITTNNEFSLLFDKNHECFAPDLVYAIRLWNDIYANDQKKKDSHTNLANTWIEKHTQYNKHAQGYEQAKGRIREITTPLKDFGAKRLKEK